MTESTTPTASRAEQLRAREQQILSLRRESLRAKHAAADAYARVKTGEKNGWSDKVNAFIVLFESTRAGNKFVSEYQRLTRKLTTLQNSLQLIESRIEAKNAIIASKVAEKRKLAEFNDSIKTRRVYSFTQRRRSCWGRTQTFHSINAHGIKRLPDGRYVADKHVLSYDVVYIYRESEARSRVELRGDVYVCGQCELSKDDVIKILSKPPAPRYGADTDWRGKYEQQYRARESYEKYSKILQNRADARNKYARWLNSLGACNNGICTSMASDPRTPYDTIRAGNSAEIAYLRNHAILKSTGAIPKLFELTEDLATFPTWETFE